MCSLFQVFFMFFQVFFPNNGKNLVSPCFSLFLPDLFCRICLCLRDIYDTQTKGYTDLAYGFRGCARRIRRAQRYDQSPKPSSPRKAGGEYLGCSYFGRCTSPYRTRKADSHRNVYPDHGLRRRSPHATGVQSIKGSAPLLVRRLFLSVQLGKISENYLHVGF